MVEPLSIPRSQLTGLILSGGLGSRMGAVEKGLQPLAGQSLVSHMAQRLTAQVGALIISANRAQAQYAALGYPIVSDAVVADAPSQAGPLGGMLAGLAACTTPYLLCVPCDTPLFPHDLGHHLARALATETADIAVAYSHDGSGHPWPEPTFCLMRKTVQSSLHQYLRAGGRKIQTWQQSLRHVQVIFPEAQAFLNANTPANLAELEQILRPPTQAANSDLPAGH